MTPILSFIATLGLLGVAITLVHALSWWLNLPDLLALLLFALPISAYCAFCTEETHRQMLGAAVRIYLVFTSVVLAAAGLVFVIDFAAVQGSDDLP